MSAHSVAASVRLRAFLLALTASAFAAALHAQGQLPVPIPGRNSNLASGPAELVIQQTPNGPVAAKVRGDFLLKMDNEGSCTRGSRNPKNILCGGNDYGLVEAPGIDPDDVVRDAGAGVYQSSDGGDTWESTMLPGHVLDTIDSGFLKNYRAFADVTVRSGAAGIAYYSGIAFKSLNNTSIGYVATFLELNNREGDKMPFKHLYTIKFDSVPETLLEDPTKATSFIDKPWSVVLPPSGAMCTIDGIPGVPRQIIPDSPVIVGYTIFANLEKDPNAMISLEMIVKITNCGRDVGQPRLVSLGHKQNGISLAVSPVDGRRVVAVWRRFASQVFGFPLSDALFATVSTDGGSSWSFPRQIANICPFEQSSTWATARVNTFPTVAIDHGNRISVAWSDRLRDSSGACLPEGQSRIVLSTSQDGRLWSSPAIVDPGGVVKEAGKPDRRAGHQITPSLTYGGGTLLLLWKDLRETKSAYFDGFISEFPLLKAAAKQPLPPPAPPVPGPPFYHHTIELYAKMANVGSTLTWGTSVRVSQYKMGKGPNELTASPKQWEIISLQMFARGTKIFDGDYADGAGPPMLPPDPIANRSNWAFDTGQGGSPVFYGVWASNRDVQRVPQHTNAESPSENPASTAIPYTPPGLTAPIRNDYPADLFQACTPGAGDFTRTMNQNLYGARISRGLFAFSPGNNKRVPDVNQRTSFQRAFAVNVRNESGVTKTYQLTIGSQPAGGGAISFTQFASAEFPVFPLTSVHVTVGPRSSATRSVFVVPDSDPATVLDPQTSARVDIVEVGGQGGQTTSVYINADPTAPEIEAPEIEAHEIYTPEIEAAQVTVHSTAAPEIEAPEIEAPEIEAPEIEAPEIEAKSYQTPEIEAPEIEAPEIEAPEIEAPEIEAAPVTTDVTFPVTNMGNTAAGYTVRTLVGGNLSPFQFQLIASRIVLLPTSKDCQPAFATMNKVAVNIRNANRLVDPAQTIQPGDIDDATIWIAPGETVLITLRVRGPVPFDPAVNPTTLAVTPQAIDTDLLDAGVLDAPVFESDLTSPNIVFVTQPDDTISGSPFAPAVQVRVQDNSGAVLPGVQVTVTLRNAPSGVALFGNPQATTDSAGIATFTGLGVSGAAADLRLMASVAIPNVPSALSRDFGVDTLANTFIVTSNADSGPNTLRGSIIAANAQPGLDLISFNLPIGATNIGLESPLPDITDPVVIDGTTQPLSVGDVGPGPSVTLTTTASSGPGLSISSGGSLVRGLGIAGFPGAGIAISGKGGNRVLGNSLVNNGSGISITGSTSAGNVIQANIIGGIPIRSGFLGNTGNGITIVDAPGNFIGGGTAAARNIIAANGGEGIAISGASARQNVIQGNYVGLAADGTSDAGNGLSGIFVVGAPATAIIGNVISGNNGFAGIAICGNRNGCALQPGPADNAAGTIIQANLIGTDAPGTTAVPNNGHGISLDGTADSLVGGGAAALGNVIANNGANGIVIFGPDAAAGLPGTTGNQIAGNSIHSNGALGIDLGGASGQDGVTPNDVGDGDAGPNNHQNFPVITDFSVAAGIAIHATLNSSPLSRFVVSFYANTSCDASGHGEGETFIGSATATTDGAGDATIDAAFTFALPVGAILTATATDSAGNTSEFSPCTSDGFAAGGALSFDGIDDFVQVPPSPSLDLTTSFTIEAWVKIDDPDFARAPLLSKGSDFGNYTLAVRGSAVGNANPANVSYLQRLDVGNFSCCSVTPGPIAFGRWTHVAVTRSDFAVRVYVDGKFITAWTEPPPPLPFVNDELLYLGQAIFQTAPIQSLKGLLDEVRIWQAERTPAEIAANFDRSVAAPTSIPELVAYWTFDAQDLPTNVVADSSAFGNHGTLGAGAAAPARVISTAPIRP